MPDLNSLANALADRYRLDRQLGQGGMATVYLAHDCRHGREVAIKVLRPDVAESLGRERFLREIQLAARLSHPHILPLYDSGEADGVLYFVMPVMQGQTLRERLAAHAPLPLDEAVRIATEVADALDEITFDAHLTFHLSEPYAMAGDTTAALRMLADAVERGFYPGDFIAMHCPFLAPLRGSAEFQRIAARAAQRVAEFRA